MHTHTDTVHTHPTMCTHTHSYTHTHIYTNSLTCTLTHIHTPPHRHTHTHSQRGTLKPHTEPTWAQFSRKNSDCCSIQMRQSHLCVSIANSFQKSLGCRKATGFAKLAVPALTCPLCLSGLWDEAQAFCSCAGSLPPPSHTPVHFTITSLQRRLLSVPKDAAGPLSPTLPCFWIIHW